MCQQSGSSRLSCSTGKFGWDTGPVHVGSVGNLCVDGLVVRESAIVHHDVHLRAGVGAVVAAVTTDGKRQAKVFATGRKSGTIVNGVGGVEDTIVGVARTGCMGIGSGIHRGWLVGGGGLVLLGGVVRSPGRSRGWVAGSLGSLPGLFLLVIGADPHSGRSAVVGEVVLNSGHRPLGNEAHMQGLEVDKESVGDLCTIEDFGADVGGVGGKGSQSHKGGVVDVDGDGIGEMFPMG